MASWTNSVMGSSFSATTYAAGVATNRDSARAGAGLNVTGKGYSVVGLNASKVEDAIQAIETYVKNVQTQVDNINANAQSSNAFRGSELQDAVKEYINSVKKYANDLCSQLLAFNDKLREVKAKWNEAVSAQATTVKDNTFTSENSYAGVYGIGSGAQAGANVGSSVTNG